MTNTAFTMPIKSSLLAIAIIFTSLTGWCTTASTNSPAKGTNSAAHAPIIISKSEFVIPAALSAGRDPFFPNRIVVTTTVSNPTNTTVSISPNFTLQGISGTKLKRFALINNRTFETGEDAEVTVNKTRVRIRCISIDEDSATIEYEGKQQQLKLKPGF